MVQKIKVSQSLLKTLSEYVQGIECGYVFYSKYISRDYQDTPTNAMMLGNYFEYMATGMLPRNGIVPEPEMTRNGMSEEYNRAFTSALLFKRALHDLGVIIADKGTVLSTDTMTGILDIIAVWNGTTCIIDLKYSGLIEDKWNDMGWHADFLEQKENILIQAVQYKILFNKTFDKNADFYFWVFDAKDAEYFRIIKIDVSQERMERHLTAVENALQYIQARPNKTDWIPKPSMKQCNKCPLRENCDARAVYPVIEIVNY